LNSKHKRELFHVPRVVEQEGDYT